MTTITSFDRTELLKREINRYLKTVKQFCEERDIKFNFVEFLTYKTKQDQYLPDCFKYLYNSPQILLNSSKQYKAFYYSADKDIQQDLHRPNIKSLFIPANKPIIQYIRSIIKDDFILK